MKLLLLLLSVVITLGTANADDSEVYRLSKIIKSPQDFPKRVTAAPHNPKRFFRWYSSLWSFPPQAAVLHAILHRGDTTYIVATEITPSARSSEKCSIVWLAIRSGMVIAWQHQLLWDQWRPIDGDLEGWIGGVLLWGGDGPFERAGESVYDEAYTAFFDPKHPEKGLQLKEVSKHPQPMTAPPNNALQRTAAGGGVFSVFRPLRRQPPSLSLVR